MQISYIIKPDASLWYHVIPCMQNLYRSRLWPNNQSKTYTVPIKKETHSFGLITPLSPHNAKTAMIIFVSCETHCALRWPGHSRANREECASLWKGWVWLTPMGCVGIGLRSKAWSSGEERRWTATVRLGDVPIRICIPGDIESCETERGRQTERDTGFPSPSLFAWSW